MTVAVDVFRDVAIPMRDGVILKADIYLPPERSAPVAALVTRTAYNKGGPLTGRADYGRLVGLGFAVVVQDKRGRFASGGSYYLLRDDSTGEHWDGYDTVEWVAAQPWCSGSVGVFGLSYLGHTTMGAAIAAPPNLRAAVSEQPSSDEFTDRMFVDGVVNLLNVADWSSSALVGSSLIDKLPSTAQPPVQADLDLYRSRGAAQYRELPLPNWPFLRHFPMLWGDPLAHRETPDYFAESRVSPIEAGRIAVPVVHVGGWFDHFTRNTVRHFELSRAYSSAPDRQRLIMGPWTHGGLSQETVAGMEYPDAALDENALIAEWMSPLHERAAEGRDGAAVYLYVLGANRWRAEEDWPIPGTEITPAYLTAGGSVSFDVADPGRRSYSYDPLEPYQAPSIVTGMSDLSEFQSGANLLAYTSGPLTEGIEITGWPRTILHASTSCTDADWLVELRVVGTDLVPRLVSEGIARARYRTSRTRPQAVVPGQVEEYVVEMRPISILVQPGEQLQVIVTGGKFPTFERNPNVFVDLNEVIESDFVTAENTIYAGGVHASRIELPVVPLARRGRWVENPWPWVPVAATPVNEHPAEEL